MANKPTSAPATSAPAAPPRASREFLVVLGVLALVLGVLFHDSFKANYVCFNNDAPLGANAGAQLRLPEGFSGVWMDSNWLGNPSLMAPDISMAAQWLMGPFGYAKFWIPCSILILGLAGWAFCKSLKFSPAACFLGALAAALHSDAFSNGCWGQVSRPMTFAASFLALAALNGGSGWRAWVRVLLAGASVGMGIMEGFDVGALFSTVVGAYVIFHALFMQEGKVVQNGLKGVIRLALVAGFAGILSAAAINSLIGTQIKDVEGMGQTEEEKAQRWDAATQYSLPKKEIVTAIFPGVFGYRVNTPGGGQYWGMAGANAALNAYYENGKQGPPPGNSHQTGAVGNYAGQLILVFMVWAVVQSFRRKNSGYSDFERRAIWFWLAVMVVCMLMMVGPYAPFYRLFYSLPFASTIRNPGKFGHMFDWAIIVLSMYGAQGICQRLVAGPANIKRDLASQWSWWLKNGGGFDRKWLVGSVVAIGVAFLGWLLYGAESESLQRYLIYMDWDKASVPAIASFSIKAVGWFALFLTLTLVAVVLVLSGYFAGDRAKIGVALMAGILVVDLGRAHQPWINHWDAPHKYAMNPVLEKLKERPWEQRVGILPFSTPPQYQVFDYGIYRIEWAQHHFLSNDIQSIDIVQMPRPPVDWLPFERAMGGNAKMLLRRWQITNTRYLLGLGGYVEALNKELDGGRNRFRSLMNFTLQQKTDTPSENGLENLTAVPAMDGPFALIEFTGALPRTRLYANWSVVSSNAEALAAIAAPEWDPEQSVIVTEPGLAPGTSTNAPGTAAITAYSSTHITVKAEAAEPSILLYNDRIAADWHVFVDGKESKLLRCNFLMRGVQVPAGSHTIEFAYTPSTKFLHITLAAIAVALVLLAVLLFAPARPQPAAVPAKAA